MAGIREYLEACRYRQDFLQQQLRWLQEESANYAAEANRLKGVADRNRQEMIGYLLPEVNDHHIASLEQRLSYPGLSPIKKDYDGRFEAAEQRRVELEAMDEIQQYDFFLDRAQREVDDISPAYESTTKKMGHWTTSKSFWKLDKRGYFELDYKPGFFRRFFDWRDVSFLMSHLTKRADLEFENPQLVRENYRLLRDQAKDITDAYEARTGERDRISGLKEEHESMVQAPERLLGELFRDLGEATASHIDACPDELRTEIARGDKNLNAFLRKKVGTEKQIQYLRELSVTRIDARIQQVKQELHKIDAKIKKLEMQRRRGKYKRYSRDDLGRMRNVKADKWERKRQKTIKMREKIGRFEKHHRGSCSGDYLWWDVITGGARADDIYEVRVFREQNPDWNYRTYDDPYDTDNLMHDDVGSHFDDAAEDLATSMSASADDDLFMDPS